MIKPEDFTLWLNGYMELCDNPPTPAQWNRIKQQLLTVFQKITPAIDTNTYIDSNNLFQDLKDCSSSVFTSTPISC